MMNRSKVALAACCGGIPAIVAGSAVAASAEDYFAELPEVLSVSRGRAPASMRLEF